MARSQSTTLALLSSLVVSVSGYRTDNEEESWGDYIDGKLALAHQQPWIFLIIVILLLSPFFAYSYQMSTRLNQQIQEIYEARTKEKKSL